MHGYRNTTCCSEIKSLSQLCCNFLYRFTKRSKVVVLVLFFFGLFLWVLLRGDSCCLDLFLVFFSVLFSIVITSFGERELVFVLLVHVFVYFARVNFCPFALPLGVRD